MDIEFTIYGEPMGKQRPKVSVRNGYPHAYTPKETIMYENKVLMFYKDKIKDTEYENKVIFDNNQIVEMNLVAYFSLTKQDFNKKGLSKSGNYKINRKYCDKKCDIDNIVKIVLDALNGICYNDDKQVVKITASKVYTLEQPRVEVSFNEIKSTEN